MPHSRVLCLCCLCALGASPAAGASDYERSYLVESMHWPATASEASSYAIDLNGDGYPDDNFGQWMVALVNSGLDVSASTGAAIAGGSLVHIVDLHSTDPGLANDPAAQADWYVGNPLPAPPLFDGTDTPTYDGTYAPGTFLAALASGSFTSPSPATTTAPVYLTLLLQIGSVPIALDVNGARLSFTTDSAGPGHMQGQLNGSVRHDDLNSKVFPAMAQGFDSIIAADPNSSQSLAIKALFDTGCAGNPGFAGDGLIEVCELQENSLLAALTAPDVQIFNPSGSSTYAPNPANTNPDSNSLGIRFTAVGRDRIFAAGFGP